MGKTVRRFCFCRVYAWVLLWKPVLGWAFGFCVAIGLGSSAFLEAQYPSALYRSIQSPMIAEPDSRTSPAYSNPAFLGMGRLMGSFTRDVRGYFSPFQLRVLDLMTSAKLLGMITLVEQPDFEDAIEKRIGELVVGLSVPFPNTDSLSFGRIYQGLLTSYRQDLDRNVLPP